MSLMRSFSYGLRFGASELSDDILGLFVALVENPDKTVEFSDEIISAGLQGRINFKRQFNIDAYEAAIRTGSNLNSYSRSKKEVRIVEASEYNDQPKVDYTMISEDSINERSKVVRKIIDAYEELANDDELAFAVKSIKSMQSVFFVEEKIDILHTIRQALNGIPASIEVLKRICRDYEVFAQQIWVVLGSGKSYDELFAC